MSTKQFNVFWSICFGIVRIRKRLYVLIAITLAISNTRSSSRYRRLVASFSLPIGLEMIRSGSEIFTPKYVHTKVKNLLIIRGRLSDKIVTGMPWRISQCLQKMLVTCIGLILVVSIAHLSSIHWSLMVTTNRFPVLVRGSGLTIILAVSAKGPLGRNSSTFHWCQIVPHSWKMHARPKNIINISVHARSACSSSGWPAKAEWHAQCSIADRSLMGKNFFMDLTKGVCVTKSTFFQIQKSSPFRLVVSIGRRIRLFLLQA